MPRKLQETDTMKALKRSKQMTLDNISCQSSTPQKPNACETKKTITINNVTTEINEDELGIRIDFSLSPSKASFSKVILDLYFEGQILKSQTLAIPQGRLTGDHFEYPEFLNMAGIAEGRYLVRVEMYEPRNDEKLNVTSFEIAVGHVPFDRKARLVRIPTIKSVTGSDLVVVSSTAKDIYREMQQDSKRELENKKERW